MGDGVRMGIAVSLEILLNIPIGPDSPWLCLVLLCSVQLPSLLQTINTFLYHIRRRQNIYHMDSEYKSEEETAPNTSKDNLTNLYPTASLLNSCSLSRISQALGGLLPTTHPPGSEFPLRMGGQGRDAVRMPSPPEKG